MSSMAGWLWLFYGARSAMWWRREYIYATLAGVILAGVIVTFIKARRVSSTSRAVAQTTLTLFGCLGVVAVACLIAGRWLAPVFLSLEASLLPNNALERQRIIGGRSVLAMDCVLAGAEVAPRSAAQQDR